MENIEQLLYNYFKEKENVIVVYLFGSYVRGNKYKNDVDVAVLLNEKSAEETDGSFMEQKTCF